MTTIVLASNNAGKLKELNALLQAQNVECLPQSAYDVPDAVEDGLSFIENALIKARHASRLSGLPALADDSGLAVDALDGEPGIHSARYAGVDGDRASRDAANNARLLAALKDVPAEARRARFHCVLAFVRHAEDPVPLICQGVWEGRILDGLQGEGGFGYDPLFWVPETGCSAAQLPAEDKNRLSHRARALRQLLAHWPL